MKLNVPISKLLFWPLVAAIIFSGLLLYSRHVPPSFEASIKGLSALIISLFALFGLKWDAAAKSADAHHLFRLRNIILLFVILGFNIVLLAYEHQDRIRVYGVPGTAIYIDKTEYIGRIPTPEHATSGLGMCEVRIPLRWGWRTIELKGNPLSPETVEEFREEIRFPSPLKVIQTLSAAVFPPKTNTTTAQAAAAVKRGTSHYDRKVYSRMKVAPLIDFPDANPQPIVASPTSDAPTGTIPVKITDPAALETCAVLSQQLNQFWVGAIADPKADPFKKSIALSEMPALLVIKIAPVQPDRDFVVIHILPNGRKSAMPLLTTTLPTRPLSNDSKNMLQNSLDRLLRDLPEALSQRIADEDFVDWFSHCYVSTQESLKQGLQKNLEEASSQRTAAALALVESQEQPEMESALALEVARSFRSFPKASAELEDRIQEIEQVAQMPLAEFPAPESAAPGDEASELSYEDIPSATKLLKDDFEKQNPKLAKRLSEGPEESSPKVFLHCVGESQRSSLAAIKNALEQLTPPALVPGIENIEGKARVPDAFEIRFFVNDPVTKERADKLLQTIKDSGKLREGASSRILFVVPSEFERRNTADLGNRFEIWPAADSF